MGLQHQHREGVQHHLGRSGLWLPANNITIVILLLELERLTNRASLSWDYSTSTVKAFDTILEGLGSGSLQII
jgi:hypothetical protein